MPEDNKEDLQFAAMPGADKLEETEGLDMNFGLGEEPVVAEAEQEEEVALEEPVAEPEPEAEAELEEEPEAELEEEPEAELEEEPEINTKKPMVPKSRLDEVLAKQKALQKQLDDMKAAQVESPDAPSEYAFSDKEVEYQNLLLDGESQKAAALRAEIRAAERAQLEYELTQKMTQTMTQNQQMTALQQAAADLESGFPVFDQSSDQYNAEYTQEVVDLRDAFIIKGDNAVTALAKAAKFVIREYGLDDSYEPTPALASTNKRAVDEVAKRRAEVSRKLKAAESQPPELPGESSANRGERMLDISVMSEEEFNALPEATIKRLRGDVL
jgi:hypothetical protein